MGFSKLNGLPSLRDVRYSCPESFNTVPDQISNLPDNRDNGQHYLRGVRCVVKYTNVCQCHLGTVHLRFSTLEARPPVTCCPNDPQQKILRTPIPTFELTTPVRSYRAQ